MNKRARHLVTVGWQSKRFGWYESIIYRFYFLSLAGNPKKLTRSSVPSSWSEVDDVLGDMLVPCTWIPCRQYALEQGWSHYLGHQWTRDRQTDWHPSCRVQSTNNRFVLWIALHKHGIHEKQKDLPEFGRFQFTIDGLTNNFFKSKKLTRIQMICGMCFNEENAHCFRNDVRISS